MVSVRQAGDLPLSFRFVLTEDTLGLGYTLPAVGRVWDFHPVDCADAGRTKILSSLILDGITIEQSSDMIGDSLRYTMVRRMNLC